MHNVKKELYELCIKTINERINRDMLLIDKAQESANFDSKNSAGDKYETTAAMMHLEKEKYAIQLSENLKLKEETLKVNIDEINNNTKFGSLVITNHGNFFLVVALGNFKVANQVYTTISMSSPLAQVLKSSRKGDEVKFREKLFIINGVY